MNFKNIFILIIIVVTSSSCIGTQEAPPDSFIVQSESISPSSSVEFAQFTGRVIQPDFIRAGGIVVAPFQAGVDAEATEELDQLALMMIKGLAEYLRENESSFVFLTADQVDRADYILEGNIEEYVGRRSLGKRLLGGRAKGHMKLSGELIDYKSGNRVIRFGFSDSYPLKEVTSRKFAYHVGQQLARYLVGDEQVLTIEGSVK